MQYRWRHLCCFLLRLGVFVGIGAGVVFASRVCGNREKRPEVPERSEASRALSRKYPYANDRMVYVLQENGTIEQWSLDGSIQKRFALPAADPDECSVDQLLWVDNEEVIWYEDEEAEDGDYEGRHVYSTPIERSGLGEELVFEKTRELFFSTDWEKDIGGIDPELLSLTGKGSVYADRSYLVYRSDGGGLFVCDRKSGGQPEELEYGNIPDYANLLSMVSGDRVLFHTGYNPGRIQDGLYGFCSCALSSKKSQVIDDRCFSRAAYVADSARNRVYYQIADDRSIWEYDYQTEKRRELISEEQFRVCYAENHLLWDDAYYYDSLFIDGERLYFIKNQDAPQIFSYVFEEAGLRYEKKLTLAVRNSGYGNYGQLQTDDDEGYLEIAEGKLLLHWNKEEEEESGNINYFDWIRGVLPWEEEEEEEEEAEEKEYYICIDLKTAEGKAVTQKDPERVYFAMLGLWMKPGTTGRWKPSGAVQEKETDQHASESPEISSENQLACISRYIAGTWEEEYDDFWAEEYDDFYYAVTDLDHNGRLELIVTSGPQGSGGYTYTHYYQVSADGQELYPVTDDARDIDIRDGIKTAYIDPETGDCYYLSKDYASAGAGARYCWFGAVILDNGMLTHRTYAETWTDWNKKKTEEVRHACHYLGGKEQRIKFRDFDSDKLAAQFFQGFEKKSVKLSWFRLPGKKDRTEQKIREKVTRSYRKFSVR